MLTCTDADEEDDAEKIMALQKSSVNFLISSKSS
jgi:hypothetical protein